MKENEAKINSFFDSQTKESEDKKKRIITLESSVRQNTLKLKMLKETENKTLEPILKQIENIKKNDSQRDEKLDDVIKELINVDYKQTTKNELINEEILKMKEPILRDLNNILKQTTDTMFHTFNNFKYLLFSQNGEDLLKELGKTQKDYKKMLKEFYSVINCQDFMDVGLKSNMLDRTSQILIDLENTGLVDYRGC